MSASPVVVLGMHRSGTSTAAAALGHLGLSLGRSLAAADEWNPRGYFEDRELVRFDDALLARLGRRWDSPLPPDAAACAALADLLPDAAALVGRCFPDPGPWAVKDPRLCLLWPFWGTVFAGLGLVPRCLVTLRRPAAVARSLGRRDGIGPARAGWLWLTHVRGALAAAAGMPDGRFVVFDDLVREPRLHGAALAAWLGIEPPAAALDAFATRFIDPALVQQEGEMPELPALVGEAFALLEEAVAAGARPGEVAAGAAWQSLGARFESESVPELRRVQAFFAGDRQATRFEERVVALSAGLAEAEELTHGRLDEIRALSAALARSESLAADRLRESTRLDAQLRDTAAALARAEELAATRLAELRRLASALDAVAADPAGASVVEALRAAERLAWARLDELEAAAGRERGLDQALTAAARLAAERLLENRRLEQALASAEQLAAARLCGLETIDGTLARTAAALADVETLARERLAALERTDRQLADTSAALERAERLALERLATIEELARQVSVFTAGLQGDIAEPVP